MLHMEPYNAVSRIASNRNQSNVSAPTRSSISTRPTSTLAATSPTNGQAATHQRFVFTDPVAFRYLEEDPSTKVLVRREDLEGYETYLVEQWACSRTHPTFMITTYTGDSTHKVVCGVLSVPTDETSWSKRLKIYFRALTQYHARRSETRLGTLMITNLSAFPSSLTVILIPEGDPQKYREHFFINENLKRLGCSGRTALNLAKPASATISKFYQLYRASDKIPVGQAVIELVKLCQVALLLFHKLEPEYADGLLCDMTEKALNDWWVEFGTEIYNIEPHDGILGPTTVAALLGLLIGARNRLHSQGCPVPKDVFDIEQTKRGIAHFQKSQRLAKTRRLDHATMLKLHRMTARAANHESWLVPRALKGTVAELSGKGGEMVMDIVGGRDKTGITDVESPDIEQFIANAGGARAKWLWYGKPRKGQTSGDMFNRLAAESPLELQVTDEGGYEWASRRKESSIESPRNALMRSNTLESIKSRSTIEDRQRLTKRNTIDSETSHKDQESVRGLSRIKDAVGRRTVASLRHGREPLEAEKNKFEETLLPSPIHEGGEGSRSIQPDFLHQDTASLVSRNPNFAKVLTETPPAFANDSSTFLQRVEPPSDDEEVPPVVGLGEPIDFDNERGARSSTASVANSLYMGRDLDDMMPVNLIPEHSFGTYLRRRQSVHEMPPVFLPQRNEGAWPRRISFSIAEDSILRWQSISDGLEPDELTRLPSFAAQLSASNLAASLGRVTRMKLLTLDSTVAHWVSTSVNSLSQMIDLINRDQETLDGLYIPREQEYHTLEARSHAVLDEQKATLEESVRNIEMLGAKLDYEINAVRGKVEDSEDAVAELERQTLALEARLGEMEQAMKKREGWLHWILRMTLGIGTVPDSQDVATDDSQKAFEDIGQQERTIEE